MVDRSTHYWQSKRGELNAAGFDPDTLLTAKEVITIASPYTMLTGATTGSIASPSCW